MSSDAGAMMHQISGCVSENNVTIRGPSSHVASGDVGGWISSDDDVAREPAPCKLQALECEHVWWSSSQRGSAYHPRSSRCIQCEHALHSWPPSSRWTRSRVSCRSSRRGWLKCARRPRKVQKRPSAWPRWLLRSTRKLRRLETCTGSRVSHSSVCDGNKLDCWSGICWILSDGDTNEIGDGFFSSSVFHENGCGIVLNSMNRLMASGDDVSAHVHGAWITSQQLNLPFLSNFLEMF